MTLKMLSRFANVLLISDAVLRLYWGGVSAQSPTQPAATAATPPGAADRATIAADSAAEREREMKVLGIKRCGRV